MPKTTNHQPTVYIEATALSRAQGTGVDFWVEGILSRVVEKSPTTQFIFFRFQEDGHKLKLSGKNVREVVITKLPARLYRLLLWLGIAPSVEWLIGEPELQTVIFPNFYTWRVNHKATKVISFVADTAFIDYPESVPNWYFRSMLKRTVAYAARRSQLIVTCSQASARSIGKHFDVTASRLAVIYPGVTKLDRVAKNPKPVHSKKFILFVGTLEPRKNVANIIKAYLALPAGLRATYDLVLAGGKGWLDTEITELLNSHALDGVVALGYVSDRTKIQLFQEAKLFVYPSLYEGFGMPVVEAQAYGVPVVTARNSSLSEAAGRAAVYTELDARSIADAMASVLEKPAVAQKLIRDGLKHAADFTWEASAKKLLELLQS